MNKDFFSAEDVNLHRTCFGRAYHVALLVSDHGEAELSWSMYAWRRGIVEARGFYILRPVEAATAASDRRAS